MIWWPVRDVEQDLKPWVWAEGSKTHEDSFEAFGSLNWEKVWNTIIPI